MNRYLLSALAWLTLSVSGYSQLVASRSMDVEYPKHGQMYRASMTLDQKGTVWFRGKSKDEMLKANDFELSIDRNDLPELKAVLEKANEWDRIAKENNALPFEKEVGKIRSVSIIFRFSDAMIPSRLIPLRLNADQGIFVLSLLGQIDLVERELMDKANKSNEEKSLFN